MGDSRRDKNDLAGAGAGVSGVGVAAGDKAVDADADAAGVASDGVGVTGTASDAAEPLKSWSLLLTLAATSPSRPLCAKAAIYIPQASSLPNNALLSTSPAPSSPPRATCSYHPVRPLCSPPWPNARRRASWASSDSGEVEAAVSSSAIWLWKAVGGRSSGVGIGVPVMEVGADEVEVDGDREKMPCWKGEEAMDREMTVPVALTRCSIERELDSAIGVSALREQRRPPSRLVACIGGLYAIFAAKSSLDR